MSTGSIPAHIHVVQELDYNERREIDHLRSATKLLPLLLAADWVICPCVFQQVFYDRAVFN